MDYPFSTGYGKIYVVVMPKLPKLKPLALHPLQHPKL
jgi:hypothetical protein